MLKFKFRTRRSYLPIIENSQTIMVSLRAALAVSFFALVSCLVSNLASPQQVSAAAVTVQVYTEQQLRNEVSTPEQKIIMVMSNIFLLDPSVITIPTGADITLVAGGQNVMLVRTNGNTRHFEVNGALTIGTAGDTYDITFTRPDPTSSTYSGGISANPGSTLTLNRGIITGNAADSGGGIYVTGGTFSMTGGIITNNYAYGVGVSHQVVDGGNTYNVIDTVAGGGGVFVTGGTFSMTGGTISDNRAAYDTSNTNPLEQAGGRGGGVTVTDGNSLTMTGGTISDNRADVHGGGLWIRKVETTISGDAKIVENTSGSAGGGVMVAGSQINVLITGNALIADNASGGTGGGVWFGSTELIKQPGTLTLSGNAQITGNTGSSGGGVNVHGVEYTFNMTGGTVSRNAASSNGGGVRLSASTFNMSGGTIAYNTANTDSGGGVSMQTYYEAVFNMSGGTIAYNTANTLGGGVRVSTGIFNMSGGIVTQNTAPTGGGAIAIASSGVNAFNMTGGEISYNTTSATGGGIIVTTLSRITISNTSIFRGNYAPNLTDIGLASGLATYPNIRWAGYDDSSAISTSSPKPGSHLLNNWDINNTTGETVNYRTVTFMSNFEVDLQIPRRTLVGGTVTDMPTFLRAGYIFVGWNSEPDGTGREFNTSFAVEENLTVYAQWKLAPPDPLAPGTGITTTTHDNASPSLPILATGLLIVISTAIALRIPNHRPSKNFRP